MRAWFVIGVVWAGCDDPIEWPDTTDFTADCTGADTFVAGMEMPTEVGEAAGEHMVRLLEATPAPPDVGDNDWVVEVVDLEGAAVAGLDVSVRPFMPLHGHGLSPAAYAGADQGDGTYVIERFDLIMPGLWEFTVDVSGDASETALFALCAEG